MKLDTRELAFIQPPQTGPDVDRLHEELAQLGDDYRSLLQQDVDPPTSQRQFGSNTQLAVATFQRNNEERLKAIVVASLDGTQQVNWTGVWGVVDPATAQLINEEVDRLGEDVVQGHVEFEDGTPAEGIRVLVHDRDIGAVTQALSPSTVEPTNAKGEFPQVRYRPKTYESGEGLRGRGTDLVFAVASDGHQRPVELVAVYRQIEINGEMQEQRVDDLELGLPAVHVQVVRLIVRRADHAPPSEYERLMAALRPLLVKEYSPDKFDEEKHRDLSFAARETGEDKTLIETVSQSWKLSKAADLPPELFYGLLRHGSPTTVQPMPSDLPTLLSFGRAAWEAKLSEAFELSLMPASRKLERPKWVRQLQHLRAQGALHNAPDTETASLADVLSHAGIPTDARNAFTAMLVDHDGPGETLWTKVSDQLKWTEAQIQLVQATLKLAEVVSSHKPLIDALFAADPSASARKLATWERRKLEELVAKTGAPTAYTGANAQEQGQAYVDDIEAQLRLLYPAAYVAKALPHVMDQDIRRAGDWLQGMLSQSSEPVAGVPAFDLMTMPATGYLREHGDRLFAHVNDDQRALLSTQLKRVQRVFQLSETPEQMAQLMGQKLESAHQIARWSQEHFVQEYASRIGGPQAAAAVHSKAKYIHGTLLNLYIDKRKVFPAVPPAIDIPKVMNTTGASVHIPSLDELFGSDDLCACESCLSVLSHAAYFVDLLQFLDLQIPGQTTTSLTALLTLRPDLAHIQLTCDNTNTRIPYVDLVNEILASYVAHDVPFPYNDPVDGVTNGTAGELRVNPISLTDAAAQAEATAHERLQLAVFPFNLPYHHWLEVIRLYLQHFEIRRESLMRRFQTDSDLGTEMAIAAERLRLSPQDFEVITVADFDGAGSKLAPVLENLFGFIENAPPATSPANHVAPEFSGTADTRTPQIKALQNFLKNISTSAGLTKPIRAAIDVRGVFNAPTEKAVQAYRNDQSLPSAGGTDAAFWGALAAGGHRALSVMMSHVPTFLRQTQVTYDDLVALVTSQYFNPLFNDKVFFSKMGITPEEIMAFVQSGLTTLPTAMQAKVAASGMTSAAFLKQLSTFHKVLVLDSPPGALCDIDQTTIRHIDGSLLSESELLALQQAIRLWKKLGWSLHEVDLLFSRFPLSSAFTLIFRVADVKGLLDDLQLPVDQLMAFWGRIDTWDEKDSLYERLFRSKTAQSLDPLFKLNDERREIDEFVKAATPPLLKDHAPLLLAAFRISAADLARLLPTLPNGSLNLDNVSSLYRIAALSRALDMSLADLLALKELCGIDPFDSPGAGAESPATVFVRLARMVQASMFTVTQLDYLFAHRISADDGELLTADQRRDLTGTLRAGLDDIQREYVVVDDPLGDKLVRQLGAVLLPPVAETLARMVYGSIVYSQSLPDFIDAVAYPAPVANKIRYDADRQALLFSGVMTTTEHLALTNITFLNTLPFALRAPFSDAVGEVYGMPELFAREKLFDLMDAAELVLLLRNTSSLGPDGVVDLAAVGVKVSAVLARVRRFLSVSLVKRTLSSALGMEGPVITALLQDEAALSALNVAGSPAAIEDFLGLGGVGLDATYFANPTPSAPPVLQQVEPGIDYTGTTPLPAGVGPGPFRARWTGFVYAPLTEDFSFVILARDGVRVEINGALVLDEWKAQPITEHTVPITLRKGSLNEVVIEHAHFAGTVVFELRWRSPSTNLALVPQDVLYTADTLATLVRPLERMEKIATMVKGFELTGPEVKGASQLGYVDWNDTPVAAPATPAVQKLFGQWKALRDFAAARDAISRREGAFVDVLAAGTLDVALDRFAAITGTDRTDLQQFADASTRHPFNTVTLTYETVPPAVSDLTWWQHLRESCSALVRSGCSAAQLVEWGKIKDATLTAPSPPVTNWYAMSVAPTARLRARAMGEDLKRLVKAKYDEATWRLVARPINDDLRARDRDALIGAVMAKPTILQEHFQTADELFEYFLIDVKMDPCMETSRIQQGIATALLFTQRGLMGLMEGFTPPVMAKHFDRQLHERMQSFALWHPSREILIHTEKYIRWDLLDRKSEPYREFERDLRKQDLTQVNDPKAPRGKWAETAFMNFLEKIDEVAKLEICGQYHDDPEDVLHVFARTQNAPYKFFYRRADQFEGVGLNTGVWTAWERFPVDIDYIRNQDEPSFFPLGDWSGVHLMPIKWNRRLYLLWPKFRLVPFEDYNRDTPREFDRQHCWEITLAWSQLWNGAWSSKQESMSSVVSRPYVAPPVAAAKDPVPKVTQVDTVPTPRLVTVIHAFPFPHTTTHWETHDEDVPGRAINELVPGDGLLITAKGDYAVFERKTTTTSAVAWLPDPYSHFFDVQVTGDRLVVAAAVRYNVQNVVAGKKRSQERVSFTVNQGNKLTFRDRTHEAVESPLVLNRLYYGDLGAFVLGTCKVRDVETFSQETAENYYTFKTPKLGGNFYQACRHGDLIGRYFAVGTPEQVILGRTLISFTVLGRQNLSGFQPSAPFFFQDRDRVYLVTPTRGKTRPTLAAGTGAKVTGTTGKTGILEHATSATYAIEPDYQFQLHCHPQVCEFIHVLNRDGLLPLLATSTQKQKDTTPLYFDDNYWPTPRVAKPYPDEEVDFSRGGAYSQYNWELFLYAPMRTWFELLKSYQFAEAEAFLKAVANLTSADVKTPLSDRVWQFVPFQTTDAVRIQDTLGLLMYTGSDAGLLAKKSEVQATIQDWLGDPFNPHLIARRRTSAYMQAVLMDCCRHYLAAADFEFTRYTMESIPMALQYLIIVLKIIGPNRPGPTRVAGKMAPETYHTLKTKGHLSPFSQFSLALSDLETELPFTHSVPTVAGSSGPVGSIQAMYFCIPPNDEWASMWDTVTDRLYKIRHCMNIDGIVQELPLYPTPINAMLLVEARAMGLDITNVFDDFRAPLPHHEFSVIFEKAVRLAEDVRSFAQRFETLVEKSESEGLAQMRVEQESKWLKDYLRREMVQSIQLQAAMRESIEKTREATESRFNFYDQQIKRGLLEDEKSQRSDMGQAHTWETMAQGAEIQSSVVGLIPDVTAGTASGSTFGGTHMGSAYRAIGGMFRAQGSQNSYTATIAALNAQWERRQDEWAFQRSTAAVDLKKVDVDFLSARIQENIATLRMENHDKTTANTEAVLDVYRQRFFNSEKYSAVAEDLYPDYFQLFQLAYQYARQAEACCRFQFGLPHLNVIQSGNWINARKGMLAGDKLLLALKQLDRVHLDADKREYEIRHDVSLVMLDPVAFIELRQTGECEFEIPETFFDAHYPGLFMRRLRSASVTIPCVVGRHTNVNCVLTLLKNKTRITSDIGTTYEEDVTKEDRRFVTTFAATQSIVTSHGQDDNGLFEADPRDGRYVPFRGAGAMSRWHVRLPIETNAFERSSLSDFMLHLPQTARAGGQRLEEQAWKAREKALKDVNGLPQRKLFRGRFESRDVWHRFLHPDGTTGNQVLSIELSCEAISTLFKERTVAVSEVDLYLIFKNRAHNAVYRAGPGLISAKASHRAGTVTTSAPATNLTSIEALTAGTPIASFPLAFDIKPGVVSTLALELPETAIAGIAAPLIEPIPGSTHVRLATAAIDDLWVIVKYTLK
ncbi:neuraminidase-like domain-containing protein [Variovorax sp. J22R133]|uniref:Tc toxin subunit A-related protein n=1 Tax=Variovorax brevis TaxID=3053503 RepID=UPI002574B937|nr:neuraminidase-like domain-containing protein [Variovorax sp. J22R133]MDM0116740.1 neuraminidase-like domain-containing protein [Variovorax sp. J22R133]